MELIKYLNIEYKKNITKKMNNFGFELKEEKGKKYFQYKNNKTFHIEKYKLKKIGEIKNEIKYKIDETKEKLNLKKIRKNIEKSISEKKENIKLKLKDKLNNEIHINNLNNNLIMKGNNNINKTYLITGEGLMKIIKDKNGFFEDKNKSRKYINFKEYLINNNIFRNIYLIIIISLFQTVLSNNNIKFIENKFSNVTLKINGIGEKRVFGSDLNYQDYPKIIYINEIKQNRITYTYNLNETDNFVELIWDKSISTCYHMFYECVDITEINLSNFNASIVTNMNAMFAHCSSLSSIDFSNFNTSIVTYMNSVFYNCSSLLSLDLSDFNTSIVTDIYSMFAHCSSLTSLDLFNFDTSKITIMDSMFSNCRKLKYINLKNFIENEKLSVTDIFGSVPDNVVICLNENSNKIKAEIKNSYILNCSVFYKEILIST